MTSRGPKNHCIYKSEAGPFGDHLYSYGPPERPSTEPFRCSCGTTGDGQVAALAHLKEKAKAAWRRLDPMPALAATIVGGPQNNSDALHLIYFSRHWNDNRQIKKCIVPFYDHLGVLCGSMDWSALARDLAAGRLNGELSDLLVLRFAISLAGVDVPLKLSDLWQLPRDDARHVREALLKQIPIDDGPT